MCEALLDRVGFEIANVWMLAKMFEAVESLCRIVVLLRNSTFAAIDICRRFPSPGVSKNGPPMDVAAVFENSPGVIFSNRFAYSSHEKHCLL